MLTATGSRLCLRRMQIGRRFRESYQTLARKQRGFYWQRAIAAEARGARTGSAETASTVTSSTLAQSCADS
jgi:hypothetical protein